jgi:hypothetical protein
MGYGIWDMGYGSDMGYGIWIGYGIWDMGYGCRPQLTGDVTFYPAPTTCGSKFLNITLI